jgi:tetratricopeptide (TPR) repeat protein
MKKFSFFLLLFLSHYSFSQVNVDSLFTVFNNTSENDTDRFTSLDILIWDHYMYVNIDSAISLSQVAIDYTHSKSMGVYESSSYLTLGGCYYMIGEYDQAINNMLKGLEIAERIEDDHNIGAACNNIAVMYEIKGDLTKAIEYYTKSLKLAEKINDSLDVAISLGNMSLIYSKLNEKEKAIELAQQSLLIYEEINDVNGIVTAINNLTGMINVLDDPEMVIARLERAIALADQNNFIKEKATSHNVMAQVYEELGNIEKARLNYEIALKTREKIGDLKGLTTTLKNLADLNIHLGEYAKAVSYATRALKIAKEIEADMQIHYAAYSLYKGQKELRNYKEALEMHELYIEIKDSLINEKNQRALFRSEYRYDYEKQAALDSVQHVEEQKVLDAKLVAEKQRSYFLYGIIALVLVFALFIYNRFRITIKQKGIIHEQKIEAQSQKEIIEEKHQEITDSMEYAKRIQTAILPPDNLFYTTLPNSFVLYMPKDIVAGDFYWMETFGSVERLMDEVKEPKSELKHSTPHSQQGTILLAAADCTGHGVPGAMVSVICNNALNRSVREYNLTDPGKILDKTREIVIQEFEKSQEDVKDGMDIALINIGFEKSANQEVLLDKKLSYAGAHNPLWIVRKGNHESASEGYIRAKYFEEFDLSVIEIKANKQPIGLYIKQESFTTKEIDLKMEDTIYMFSDGFADQFGGDVYKTGKVGKKLKAGNFKRLLASMNTSPMKEQKETLRKFLNDWRGDLEQIDDVCVIGVKVSREIK